MQWHIPYGDPSSEGYWGIPTSTIDWCEENYVVSPYIAECVNTITNAGFVFLAAFALQNVIQQRLEKRFLIVAVGFITVGVGSWLFHMTLKYEYQLLDELPMIYATCVPYWIVFSFGKTSKGSFQVGAQIALAAAVLTAVYLHYRNPTIHQAGYAFLNCIIVIKSVALSKQHVQDEVAQRHLMKTLVVGLTTFLSGYGIWNLDIHFCEYWRSSRRSLGMPLGFLLEGHGWWHLLTGMGGLVIMIASPIMVGGPNYTTNIVISTNLSVYYYVSYLEYLRQFLIGTQDDYQYDWVLFGILPRVVLKANKAGSNSKNKKNSGANTVSTRSGRKSRPSRKALEALRSDVDAEKEGTPRRRKAAAAKETSEEPEQAPESASPANRSTRGSRSRSRSRPRRSRKTA